MSKAPVEPGDVITLDAYDRRTHEYRPVIATVTGASRTWTSGVWEVEIETPVVGAWHRALIERTVSGKVVHFATRTPVGKVIMPELRQAG